MDYEVIENYEIKKHTTFKIGGIAKRVFFPKSVEAFINLLHELENPVILGACSNVLISDDGIEEDVILTTKMNNFSVENNRIYAECGVKVPMLAKTAEENSLSGMEFMIGFPGSIGGAVYMNASAHSQSISDTFVNCRIFDLEKKEIITLNKEEMKFGYRTSIMQSKQYVLLDANFELRIENKDEISSIMKRNLDFRKDRQPNLATPNAGSIFKNPANDSAGRLLEKAGVKGLKCGGASVWLGHANFIINDNNATSKDVSNLMNKMYNMVKTKYTIELIPEVRFIGKKSKEEVELWNMMLKK